MLHGNRCGAEHDHEGRKLLRGEVIAYIAASLSSPEAFVEELAIAQNQPDGQAGQVLERGQQRPLFGHHLFQFGKGLDVGLGGRVGECEDRGFYPGLEDLLIHRLGKGLPVGEMPVEGGIADTGGLGDPAQSGRSAIAGELLLSGRDDLGDVRLGSRAARASCDR